MVDKTWKAVERDIAKIIAAERVPITGRARGSAPDIKHPWMALEVKHRKTLPAWLEDAMTQAEASATNDQLPTVILHQANRPHGKDYVVVRLNDFVEWFGK